MKPETPTMSQTAINIRHLNKSFGDITAVHDLSLTVERGEMFALVGPDGAGKTTAIRILCGIIPPDAGEVTVLGFDLKKERREIVNRIGYLSQRFSLYGDLSIDENIEFFAEIHNIRDYHARRDELLDYMRLTKFRTRYAEQLSGGMKQKLALACTLIHKPEIIFLDEPTTGVDPVSRRDFWQILSDLLKSGITIIMTTPYLDEAERCQRVGLMNNGSMMIVDTPMRIKGMMDGTVVELICGDIRTAYRILKEAKAVREVQAFGDRLNLILDDYDTGYRSVEQALKKHDIIIQSSRIVTPSLENVFISLMQSDTARHAELQN
jgi:ABC-2 type transport system ATP-binding protein